MSSPYEEMFGEPRIGRPQKSVGIRTGDNAITQTARRRAARVLRLRHKEEFEQLMRDEADFLLNGSKVLVLKD